MIIMHYILDENKNPIPEPDLFKWARWYQDAQIDDARRIGEYVTIPYGDTEVSISTVFLSLPHVSLTDDRPMFYETMVFGPDAVIEQLSKMSEMETRSIMCQAIGGWDIQKRYHTREEAERGHQAMVQFVTVCLAKGLKS